MNNYAYGLMGRGKQDEALKVFKQNVKDHPKSWNAHDSLAEAYATLGKKKDAVKHYQEALQIVKDAEQRKRIETSIAKLQ
jgi:Tfp pilus assembly protein PilF